MNIRRHSAQHASASRLVAALAAGLLSSAVLAEESAVEFNSTMIRGGASSKANWSRFASDEQVPGRYGVDVRVNNTFVARRDIELRAIDDGSVQLCLEPALLDQVSLDVTRLARAREASEATDEPLHSLPTETVCDALSNYVPDAAVDFDADELVLNFSIPQAYLARDPRGWVNPELWDVGINAGRLSYSINHQQLSASGYGTRSSTTGVLNAGVNLAGWRFRHNGHFAYGTEHGASYRPGRTLAQRDLRSLGAQLTLGESTTSGDLFDGVSYRGINVSTDPRMLQIAQTGYAPTVRGIAQSNARVAISQRGKVIYEIMVPPGPFEIDDLSSAASSGDLDVEVTEADGRVQRFVVPFAVAPQLLRKGQQRYSVTAGLLDDSGLSRAPRFVEGTVRRGLTDQVTMFGGVTVSDGYGALLLGGALNTRLGAFSGDVTFAKTRLPGSLDGSGGGMSGQSYRLTYSKELPASGTHIAVSAMRYSTRGYLSLSDAVQARELALGGIAGQPRDQQRSRVDVYINQSLGERGGRLFVSGSSADYWGRGQRTTSFALGYSNTWGGVTYSISGHRIMERALFGDGASRQSTAVSLNLSIPLGKAGAAGPRLSASLSHEGDGRPSARVGVNGVFGAERQGNYGASISQGADGGINLNADASYRLSVANAGITVSRGRGTSQLSLGASGGVVVHGGGVTFSQQMGDTIGLLHVPNAPGANLENVIGVKTDSRGYAVVPNMTPYRRNEILVDPKGLPLDVELKSASATAVPTAGAVVRVVIPTTSGRTTMIEALRADGQPLPFGVDVTNEAGEVVGVVGQASRLWARGIEEAGRLFVRWGEGEEEQCAVDYNLAGAASDEIVVGQCSPDPRMDVSVAGAAGSTDGAS